MLEFAGGIAFSVNVRDFFQLQRAFKRHRIIDVASYIDEVFTSVQLFGKAAAFRIGLQRIAHMVGQALQFFERWAHGCIVISAHLSNAGREQEQHRKLGGKTLGCCDGYFFTGVGKQGGVGFFGKRGIGNVADGQRLRTFSPRHAQRRNGVDGGA